MKDGLFIGGTMGLGLELAKLACKKEFKPVIAGRTAESLKGDPAFAGSNAVFAPVDVTKPQTHFMATRGYDLVAWTVGKLQKGRFSDLSIEEIAELTTVNLTGPAQLLNRVVIENVKERRPMRLIVVSSTSSWTVREDEAMYGALKAAVAQLARNLGRELPKQLPGSKVTLICPGGMATPFWTGRDIGDAKFMDPANVASLVWTCMESQDTDFREVQIFRQKDGSARVEDGARLPA